MTKYTIQATIEKADCLVLPAFEEGVKGKEIQALDADLAREVGRAFESKDMEGKKLQTLLFFTPKKDVPRVLLIGLGKQEEFTVRRWKEIIGAATRLLQEKKYERLALLLSPTISKILTPKIAGETTVLAAEVAQYAFDEYKNEKSRVKPVKEIMIVFQGDHVALRDIQKGMTDGQIIAEAVNHTRQLGNTPPTIMTPSFLATEAEKVTKKFPKIKAKILSRAEMKKLGMGCILGVSQGSIAEPKFIILEYWGGKKKEKPTIFIGKGITFDSGGLSLKMAAMMVDMKYDMLGAATVLGIVRAVAALGVKKNIIGLLPCAENMPSGSAYRPDDILVAMDGTSVEILNTDAEGRLVLADALCYAKRYNPKEVIDFATLTGACMIAVGTERSGLFTKDEQMQRQLIESGKRIGEELWPLPLGEEFTETLKSEVADIKNVGEMGRPGFGGASIGAAFLEHFTAYPWAHIDMSSCYYGGKGKPWIRYGANGCGVQTGVEYLRKSV